MLSSDNVMICELSWKEFELEVSYNMLLSQITATLYFEDYPDDVEKSWKVLSSVHIKITSLLFFILITAPAAVLFVQHNTVLHPLLINNIVLNHLLLVSLEGLLWSRKKICLTLYCCLTLYTKVSRPNALSVYT